MPRPHLAVYAVARAAILKYRATWSIRPHWHSPTASQPLRAPRSDSVHPQLCRTLLSTPCTSAVASQQASHHHRGRAIAERSHLVGAHTANTTRASSGQTITTRVFVGGHSSSLAVWFASLSLWLTGTLPPLQVRAYRWGGNAGRRPCSPNHFQTPCAAMEVLIGPLVRSWGLGCRRRGRSVPAPLRRCAHWC